VNVRPLSDALGAEIGGVDVREVDDAQFRAIHAAWLDHLVLLFRDQQLDPDAQIRFSRRFGALQTAPVNSRGTPWLPDYPEMAVMSNIVDNGVPQGSLGAGEAIWHTDMSYCELPPTASLLYALEVPADGGGDTGFANMYQAWDALDAGRQAQVRALTVVHDSSRSSADELRKGFSDVTDPREAPGARHPAVRTHPETGRQALFLGRRRNAYVVGRPLEESEALLDELWQHATGDAFTWHHRWRPGDLLVWDNRCVLHRRDAFDATLRRRMHRTQVAGTARPC
jgi:taurine dioxygenase